MNQVMADRDWTSVCRFEEIIPDTGVCALVDGEQVAVFRVGGGALYAIDNIDPDSGAAVLSRGLVGSLGDRVVVASPIHKQHFDLLTGECLEAPSHSVHAWQVRCDDGAVQVRRGDP